MMWFRSSKWLTCMLLLGLLVTGTFGKSRSKTKKHTKKSKGHSASLTPVKYAMQNGMNHVQQIVQDPSLGPLKLKIGETKDAIRIPKSPKVKTARSKNEVKLSKNASKLLKTKSKISMKKSNISKNKSKISKNKSKISKTKKKSKYTKNKSKNTKKKSKLSKKNTKGSKKKSKGSKKKSKGSKKKSKGSKKKSKDSKNKSKDSKKKSKYSKKKSKYSKKSSKSLKSSKKSFKPTVSTRKPIRKPSTRPPTEPYTRTPIRKPSTRLPIEPYTRTPIRKPSTRLPIEPATRKQIIEPIEPSTREPILEPTMQENVEKVTLQPFKSVIGESTQQAKLEQFYRIQNLEQPTRQPVFISTTPQQKIEPSTTESTIESPKLDTNVNKENGEGDSTKAPEESLPKQEAGNSNISPLSVTPTPTTQTDSDDDAVTVNVPELLRPALELISEEDFCICTAKGDPHYKTFDNVTFSLAYQCNFLLAAYKNQARKCNFSVVTHNKRRQSSAYKNRAFTQSLDVIVGQEVIHIGQGRKVLLNGEEIQLPQEADVFSISQFEDFVRVRTSCDVIVDFDGDQSARVIAPRALFAGQLEGLCGNCDGQRRTDWILDSRRLSKEQRVTRLAQEYMQSGDKTDEETSCPLL